MASIIAAGLVILIGTMASRDRRSDSGAPLTRSTTPCNCGAFGRSTGMGKYDPLRDRLERQPADGFEFSWAEIEGRPGERLPNTASRPRWRASVTAPQTPHVQRGAWRAAGFDAFLFAGEYRVRLHRAR